MGWIRWAASPIKAILSEAYLSACYNLRGKANLLVCKPSIIGGISNEEILKDLGNMFKPPY
jgi:hypothetical protein